MSSLDTAARIRELEEYMHECAAETKDPALPKKDRIAAAFARAAAASRLRQLRNA